MFGLEVIGFGPGEVEIVMDCVDETIGPEKLSSWPTSLCNIPISVGLEERVLAD